MIIIHNIDFTKKTGECDLLMQKQEVQLEKLISEVKSIRRS